MLLRARVILPITAPPIEDGAVRIEGERIVEVGRYKDLTNSDSHEHDLGEVILMPGLINAHCHLDYTNMGGVISPPSSFVDWIQTIIALKADWTYSDYANSWIAGANQLLESGCTTVADIECVPELIPEVWRSTPMRVHTFHELISVRGRQTPRAQVAEAVANFTNNPNPNGGVGLSPHAPYSTSSELRDEATRAANENSWCLCMHIAESEAEDQMFRNSSGEMFDWLARNNRSMADCGQSPVKLLHKSGMLSDHTIAVHCNELDSEDIELIARTKTHVVHCPQSHAYFGHNPFPLKELQNAGVNISLGTDSLASTKAPTSGLKPRLNLFDEVKQFAKANPNTPPQQISEMVTINSATALGHGDELGQVVTNAHADFITIPHSTNGDPYEALLEHEGLGSSVMINGRWIYAPLIG
ncbi:MAG: hypothetical protein CMO80_15925 [Verrucomicrobiales bacterium]|nr:hypothetical protein [Verrucomicrobiales bacterium]|tara:strand:- start:3898 stop:5142 length:1245 start_codon:yes stop_codon:yes gene_type:complete